MPKGAYNAKVELFADYCSMDMLDEATKDYAFRYIHEMAHKEARHQNV